MKYFRTLFILALCMVAETANTAKAFSDGSGTSAEPYLINSNADWEELVTLSRTADATTGKYFKVTTTIEEAAALIHFSGNLYGNNVSSVNLSNASYFCYWLESGAAIHDLIVRGTITGSNLFVAANGGATLTNCLFNCSVDDTSDPPLIYRAGGSPTFEHCIFLLNGNAHYIESGTIDLQSFLTGGYAAYPLATNAAVSLMHSGAMSILGGMATAYTGGFTYDQITYYLTGSTVTFASTLGLDSEQTIATYNGNPATYNGDDTWSFTMPAQETTVFVTGNIPYIDADGTQRFCTDFTVLGSGSYMTKDGGWYVVTGNRTINGGSGTATYALLFNGDTHLILCDGATLTVTLNLNYVNSRHHTVKVNGNLTVYGQSQGTGKLIVNNTVHFNGNSNKEDYIHGIRSTGNITINGGTIDASATDNKPEHDDAIGIKADGDFTFNGGNVRATAENKKFWGLFAGGTITLGWRSASDRFYVKQYNKSVTIRDGQTFAMGSTCYSGTVSANTLNKKTLMGVDVLYDGSANNIAALNGKQTNIFISDRTLYKDGKWNTLCLPFDATLDGTLSGATAMALTSSSFNGTTLTLNFTSADGIEAGKPYLVKWDDGDDIVTPTFDGVTVKSGTTAAQTDNADFTGIFSPTTLAAGSKSILYLGAGNNLYYPSSNVNLNSFRAYFTLKGLTTDDLEPGGGNVKEIRLSFGDTETGIDNSQLTIDNSSKAGAWYSLDGVKLSGKPSPKGLYIHNGKKFVIK